jgi:hypothetical protein
MQDRAGKIDRNDVINPGSLEEPHPDGKPWMTDTQSNCDQHDDQGEIFLVEDGHNRQAMNAQAFTGPMRCAVVHELNNNNTIAGGRNGGATSAYRTGRR